MFFSSFFFSIENAVSNEKEKGVLKASVVTFCISLMLHFMILHVNTQLVPTGNPYPN